MSWTYSTAWDPHQAKIKGYTDYSSQTPDFYIPGGQQFAVGLDDSRYIGQYQGHRYQSPTTLRSSKYQWSGMDIGEVDTMYDYDALGLDSSLIGQLRNLFSVKGTGGLYDDGKQWAVWENDPIHEDVGDTGYYLDDIEESTGGLGKDVSGDYIYGTGDYGRMDFLDYANIFDRNSLASTLSMIEGRYISPESLPEITPTDVMRTKSSFYTPMEVGARKGLLDRIMSKYTEVGTGGFAGSGMRRRKLGDVRKVYTNEMEKVYGDIEEARLAGKEKLSDKISRLYETTRT